MTQKQQILHATTVTLSGRGVMILGPSGAGKSALALQLMAMGAALVADDRTVVERRDNELIASAPPSIAGLIEARGVGLINVPYAGSVPIRLIIDLARNEPERLPQEHSHTIAGLTRPCLYKTAAPHFPAAIKFYIEDTKRFPDAQ